MSIPLVSALNKYGKTALLCVVLSFAVALTTGTAYWFLSLGLFGLALLVLARAMHVADKPDEYPQDRESDFSERERRRQKELEGEKGMTSG